MNIWQRAKPSDDLAVLRDAPALSRISEGAKLLERAAVINKADLSLPGQLDQLVFPEDDAFPKIRSG